MTGNISGLNFDISDGYYKIFNRTALAINDDQWVYTDERASKCVATEHIEGGIASMLDIDRMNGTIDRVVGIEMCPSFALLMLQTRQLYVDLFGRACEGEGWIRLPPSEYSGVMAYVSILSRLGNEMRTVDLTGGVVR